MNFIVVKANLKEGLSFVERSAGGDNLPILKNVLIETLDNKISLTTTNLELAATYFVQCKVIEKGKFTAPVNILSGLISNIPAERINISERDKKLEVKADNYEALVQGSSADEFPITPKVKNLKDFIELKSSVLKGSLSQTIIAAQFSDLRPELNSVLFDFTLDSLVLAATDSFRLSEKTIGGSQTNTSLKEAARLLVPLRTAQELVRVLGGGDEPIKIYHDESQVLFRTGKAELLSRLVEGNFPDYKPIIPSSFSSEIVIGKEDFSSALKLAGVFGSKNSEVKIKVVGAKRAVEISSADPSLGENKSVVGAKVKGEPQSVTFSWRYLSDVLKALEGENIFLGVNGESDPVLIKSAEDGSYFYILKPIASV